MSGKGILTTKRSLALSAVIWFSSGIFQDGLSAVLLVIGVDVTEHLRLRSCRWELSEMRMVLDWTVRSYPQVFALVECFATKAALHHVTECPVDDSFPRVHWMGTVVVRENAWRWWGYQWWTGATFNAEEDAKLFQGSRSFFRSRHWSRWKGGALHFLVLVAKKCIFNVQGVWGGLEYTVMPHWLGLQRRPSALADPRLERLKRHSSPLSPNLLRLARSQTRIPSSGCRRLPTCQVPDLSRP